MQTMLAPSGAFENFRLATQAEINALYDVAGLGSTDISSNNFYTGAILTSLTNYLQLTGSTPTFASTELSAQRGYNTLFITLLSGGLLLDQTPNSNSILDVRSASAVFVNINQKNLNLASSYIGFYLVCKSSTESECTYTYTPAPEPSMIGLFGGMMLSLAGIAAHRRLSKK